MRHVVVHYRIYKNAGSTTDAILRQNFWPHCESIEGSNPWDTVSPEALQRLVLNNPNVAVVSSHQARLPVPNLDNISFHPILFLRHPIDQVGSVYSFERNQPSDSPSLAVQVARASNFSDYVRWRLRDGNGVVFRNYQTVYLAARQHDTRVAVATKSDLQTALKRLADLPLFGLVEFYSESVINMREYLAPYFGFIDVGNTKYNESIDRRGTLYSRLEDIKSELGASIYQELLDNNALDISLYDAAKKQFLQMVSSRDVGLLSHAWS